jgi:hypothetical protein
MPFSQELDFHHLSNEEYDELSLFEDYLKLDILSVSDLEQLLKENPHEKYYLLAINGSKTARRILKKGNVVHWIKGHKEISDDFIEKSEYGFIERYVAWLLQEKKKIIFLIPKNFFTYHTYKKNKELDDDRPSTISEFDMLVQNMADWDPAQVTFVHEKPI